ncbi:hypothetical protein Zm00014a_006312 [Zea mays]|uniref:Uncharacterized protein n=1 Tax=Zea mays TaxID=4577 RepID=A0A3L6DQ64_MAIZE|nr:hypothetical protein Zm00014a_006312 [Zea mays]
MALGSLTFVLVAAPSLCSLLVGAFFAPQSMAPGSAHAQLQLGALPARSLLQLGALRPWLSAAHLLQLLASRSSFSLGLARRLTAWPPAPSSWPRSRPAAPALRLPSSLRPSRSSLDSPIAANVLSSLFVAATIVLYLQVPLQPQ